MITQTIGQAIRVGSPETITVLVGKDATEEWPIEVETVAAHQRYRLTLRSRDGRQWAAAGTDVFACLLDIRNQIEPDGLRLCCNGSRRNAWSSGMQRDMGQGFVVYLLSKPRAKVRPPQVRTLGPALPGEVVSVAEQLAWHTEWLASPLTQMRRTLT